MEDVDYDQHGEDHMEDTSISHMVKSVVRLALASEYQRRPVRRSDINEKVVGMTARHFKPVLAQAQAQLRTIFGMELVELPAREKVTLQQLRAAQKSGTQSKQTTSWILVSTLPSALRVDGIARPAAAPTVAEESKYIGIYTLAVALIMLSGGMLKDAKMDRYLRRVGLEDETPVRGYDQTEKLLKRMEKDGYIYKIKEHTGTSEDEIYWIVGPRGKTEVGDHGVKNIALAMYGDVPEDQQAEVVRKIDRSLGINDNSGRITNQQSERKAQGDENAQQDTQLEQSSGEED